MNRRIAVVTGVSRLKGIGRAICCELASRNIDVFFTYWMDYDNQMPWKVEGNEPDLIQQEIQAFGVSCEKLELDLTVEGSVNLLLETVQQKLGKPSILVNNATYSTETSIDNFVVEELDKHYAVNMRATTLLTIEFIRQFSQIPKSKKSEEGRVGVRKQGRIINLTSGQSLGQMSNEIAYAITKGAIETLTYTLAQTIAAKGITINAVNPGPNDTGWMDEKLKGELIKQFPMKRIGTPKDTAKLIGFLVSEDAEWITGQIIHSEGGFVR